MRIMRVLAIGWVVLAMANVRAAADEAWPPTATTPVMVSLVTPVQAPAETWDVTGLRLNLIYGCCRSLYGLDIGLANQVQGEMQGLQIGAIVNLVDHPEARSIGLQLGLVNSVLGVFSGMQVGAVNYAERGSVFQVGVFNGGDYLDGLQIGLINVSDTMIGCQLGLVNVIQDNDVPFLPIFNCSF